MKATKKIVGAACALVAAVALSAGSTFAWFSMSGTVTATGMNVKATTSKNLVIGLTNNGEFASTAAQESPKNTLTELSPASTIDAKSFFYVSNPEKVKYEDGATSNGAKLEAATNSADGSNPKTTYYVQYEYYVKADTTAGSGYSDLWVSAIDVKDSVNSNAANSRISNALRVAVTYQAPEAQSAKTYIYAPVYIPKESENREAYDGVKAAGTVGDTSNAPQYEAVSLKTASTTVGDTSLGKVTDAATKITITVWYEGQDKDCTSGNSISVEALSIVVSLTASGAVTPST